MQGIPMKQMRRDDFEFVKECLASNTASEKLRIRLEDGSLVPLRENYVEQLELMVGSRQYDRSWLRPSNDGYFFVSQAGVVLPVFVMREEDYQEGELLYILLDQSGSMQTMNDAAYEGVRELLQNSPDSCKFIFSTFASNVSLGSVMNKEEALGCISCRVADGTTSMYDGICGAIGQINGILEMNPSKKTLIIVTDGQDTSSRLTVHDAKRVLQQLQDSNSRVLFLGSNQDAVLAAGNMGIGRTNALTFHASAGGQREAFRVVNESQERHRSGRDASFTPTERMRSNTVY